uniref:Glycoprotein n=1 Tax=Aristolochia-associated cytorhabdovirus TaxID=3071548 RepID=A0AA50QY50_9RHAB|nr:glycoprotein [Aristolochia-associated cytorhabdovirus]
MLSGLVMILICFLAYKMKDDPFYSVIGNTICIYVLFQVIKRNIFKIHRFLLSLISSGNTSLHSLLINLRKTQRMVSSIDRRVLLFGYIVCHLILLKSAYGGEVSIHMPQICDSKIEADKLTTSMCFQTCSLEGLQEDMHEITLYHQDSDENMTLVECQNIKTTIIATQTWTFSKIPTVSKDELMAIGRDECIKAYNENCKSLPCETDKPKITPEYHYASDHVQSSYWTKVKAYQKALPMSFSSTTKLHIEGDLVDYKDGYAESKYEEKKIYVWIPRDDIRCDMKASITYQCNRFTKPADTEGAPLVNGFLCNRASLLLFPKLKMDIRYCNNKDGMMYDKSGIIYSIGRGGRLKPDGLPMFTTSMSDALRTTISQSRVQMLQQEERDCKLSCLSFSLPTNLKPTLFGKTMIAAKGENMYQCRDDHHCKLVKPLQICHGQNLIRIICQGKNYWWNPSYISAFQSTSCNSSYFIAEHFSFVQGGELYFINATSGFIRGDKEVNQQIHIPNTVGDLEVISEENLRQSHINRFVPIPATEVKMEEKVVSAGINLGISDWLSEIDHDIKVWIVIILASILFMIMAYRVVCNKKSQGDTYPSVIYSR